ncbi:hypothetical protein C2G38_2035181 [Gigaspora rosea]|uniref:Uncharacterized protein n=1 Tax=Gigaspora rosea TaxID=44941 RepID=A0A397VGU0_9GLOM|nr:hypothetical protein C2G38_2035181 [Gigaspora rosea]CAG8488563.1 755_t:CDS:2 [Gigaspora rosea]
MKKLFFSIFVSFVVYLLGIETIFALPNDTSSNTTWIPISTQQNTGPDALDFYYLLFNLSYPAKGQLPIYIIVNPNGKIAPSQVSLSLYDEFNSIKLLDIADAPLTNHEIATPFIIYTWNVASEIQSNFDFTSGYFTLVMSYNDGNTNVTKDRRIKLSNVAANPGGALNPAFTKNINNNTNNTNTTNNNPNNNGKNNSAAISTISITTISIGCIFAFIISQLILSIAID